MAGSPILPPPSAQRVVIGVGDVAVSSNPTTTLTTYALGSCVGVVVYDAVLQAGGILHLMLPASSIAVDRATKQPAMFADTGLPLFFTGLAALKTVRSRLKIYLAGGACVLGGPDIFKIGVRNAAAVQAWLAAQGLPVVGVDLGGTVNRSLHLELSTGQLSIKLPDSSHTVALG
ncbi:MAG: chemotaxis protein CheD [Rariglobus sp.]